MLETMRQVQVVQVEEEVPILKVRRKLLLFENANNAIFYFSSVLYKKFCCYRHSFLLPHFLSKLYTQTLSYLY